MSHITDIIITTAIDDNYEESIREIKEYIKHNYKGYEVSRVDNYVTGRAAMQCDMFILAIKNMNIDDFLSLFMDIKWEFPESAQVLIKDEDDDQFKAYTAKT